jgi:polar amino acid transport system substrate-binding protein
VKVTANDRIPFLTSGKIDFVLAAMTRTSARAKVIDFTVPVHTEALAVLTTGDKPYKNWKDLDDPSVRLVSVRGTTGANFIQQNLPKAKLTLLDDQPENVTMIAQGRADAAVSVVDYLGQQMNKHKVAWRVLPAINVSYCSAGIAHGNTSLRNWMNVAIFELQTKGWLDAAWKKWFGIEQAFPVQPNPYF